MSEITEQLVQTNSYLSDMATFLIIIAVVLICIFLFKDSHGSNTGIEKRLDELIEEIRRLKK